MENRGKTPEESSGVQEPAGERGGGRGEEQRAAVAPIEIAAMARVVGSITAAQIDEFTNKKPLPTDLADMPNVGAETKKKLVAAGIETPEQLIGFYLYKGKRQDRFVQALLDQAPGLNEGKRPEILYRLCDAWIRNNSRELSQ